MMPKLISFIPLFSSFPILLFITIPLLQLCPTTSSAVAAAIAISGRKSNETDHQALLQFKSKITSDPFAVFTSWNTSIHFCQWHGVRCGRRHQRVTRLDLRSSKLAGTISPHVGNLSFLRVLDLQNNSFSNEIPPEIGHLYRLEYLYLRNNTISGQIPSNISNLSNLVQLKLSANQLIGYIPQELGSLSKLELLTLENNNLTESIPHSLGNLSYLVILVKIFWLGAYLILWANCPVFICCINLQTLDLNNNLFEGSIPLSLNSLRALEYLDFSHNRFSEKIPDFLPQLNALQYLNLSFNNLEGSLPTGGIFQNASATSIAGNSKLCGGIPEFQLWTCNSKRPNKKGLGTRIKLVIGIAVAILGLMFVLFSFWLLKRIKAPALNNQANTIIQLSYRNLYEATEGFSLANLIGEGSFGSVYKGALALEAGRTLAAVKVLNLTRLGAFKSFKAECEALKNIRHRNLVRVLTVCSSIDSQGNDFRALVYEFMVNGSLEEWLHHHPVRANIIQRLHIAIDVACALDYLHHQNETPIVHCDLKPSNILLDEKMTARVGDFGLARFLLEAPNDSNGNQSSSMGVRGTVGYAPPGYMTEYGMGNEVAICGDAYSYGILLLEMFTGKRPVDDMFTEGLNLHNFVQSFLPEQVTRILDPVLHQEIEETSRNQRSMTSSTQRIEELLVSILKIGVACSVETPGERLRMDEVAAQLISIRGKILGAGRRGERRS